MILIQTKILCKWYGARDESLPQVLVVGTTEPKALTKTVESLSGQNDIIIMDGTPNLSEMNTRVMITSDLLIIPIRPGANDFRAMGEYMTRLNQVRELKENLPAYFLINEFDERKTAHKTVKEALQQNFDIPILKTVIKNRTVYGESALMGTGVYELTDDKAKAEMIAFTNEIFSISRKKFIN